MEPDRATMERVFSLLRHDWVYDFFFSSRNLELDMLEHAATKGFISTAELDISTLATGNALESALQVGEHHRLLLMPSFTTGSITVGFAVNEKIASSSSVVSRDRYIGRIARDDENGTCLFIAEDFNEHITEVSYYTLFSPAHREHVFSLYKAKAFRQVMKSMREHYDPGELTKAVIYYYYSTEARPCPECGAETTDALTTCTCKLPLRRKLHAMDNESEMKNLQSYTGGYCGVASVGFYNEGKSLYRANFASNSATRLTGDPDVQRRLALWALRSAFKERSISPLAFTMGPGGLGGKKAVSVLDSFLLASIAESVLSEQSCKRGSSSSDTHPTSVGLLEDGTRDEDQHNSADDITAPTAPLSESSNQTSVPTETHRRIEQTDNSGPEPKPAALHSMPSEKATAPPFVPASQMMPFVQYMPQIPQPVQTQIVPQTPVVLPMSVGIPAASEAPSAGPQSEQLRRDSPIGDYIATVSEARSVSAAHSGSSTPSDSSAAPSLVPRQMATSVERRPELIPLAPAPGGQRAARFILPSQQMVASTPGVAGGVSKALGEEMDERRKKAEQRKARNRESAQRSNQKRKMRIQALKEDIAEAMRRETYLRAREKVLREENRTLRMTVSK